MKAIVITQPGGPEVLSLTDRPEPVPARGEILVRVKATGVNRADLLQRMGMYPAPADSSPDIPGLEYAGEVAALGEGVSQWSVGDRVFGLAGGGAYAEALVTHARAAARIPDELSFEEAAAIPEAFITAYDAIVTQAGLRGGQPLLVHAVGSGVGTAAVQLGRALGALVIGTARTPDKLARAKALGLHHGITVGADARFADDVNAIAKDGVAVILELVSGGYLADDLRCVAPQGHIAIVGLTAGAKVDLDLGVLLRKRIRMFGTVLRARPLEEKITAMRIFAMQIIPLFERGLLKPVVDCTMKLADAGKAHERMAKNESFGKIVLTL